MFKYAGPSSWASAAVVRGQPKALACVENPQQDLAPYLYPTMAHRRGRLLVHWAGI